MAGRGANAEAEMDWGVRPPGGWHWYLAASWAVREEAARLRDETRRRAPQWHCLSHWIDYDGDRGSMAAVDACGAVRVEALVLLAGARVSPGKYTELGLALASGVPVWQVRPEGEGPPPPQAHTNIFDELVGTAVAWETWLARPFAGRRERHAHAVAVASAMRSGDALGLRSLTRSAAGDDDEGRGRALCAGYFRSDAGASTAAGAGTWYDVPVGGGADTALVRVRALDPADARRIARDGMRGSRRNITGPVRKAREAPEEGE